MDSENKERVILSGIRATGRLHLGNYLGAVKNFVKFQKAGNKCMYFLADWHTLTTIRDNSSIKNNSLEIVKDYLAAGLDPNISIIYCQSSVPEIAELTLYLGMIQPLGELMTVPTYKDLVRSNADRVTHGLLTYPVMMAADILGPQANLVPVGKDQVPNIEIARSLARSFNGQFGETFTIPEPMEEMIKVPGLDGEKMGKSQSENSIDINSPMSEIEHRYKTRGVTDPKRVRINDPGDPYHGCRSIYPVHEIITPGEVSTREIADACIKGKIGCSDCKKILIRNLTDLLVPFQERRKELEDKDDYVRDILSVGGKQAREVIRTTLSIVREKIGITVY